MKSMTSWFHLVHALRDGMKKVSYCGQVNKRSGRVNGGPDEGKWLTDG